LVYINRKKNIKLGDNTKKRKLIIENINTNQDNSDTGSESDNNILNTDILSSVQSLSTPSSTSTNSGQITNLDNNSTPSSNNSTPASSNSTPASNNSLETNKQIKFTDIEKQIILKEQQDLKNVINSIDIKKENYETKIEDEKKKRRIRNEKINEKIKKKKEIEESIRLQIEEQKQDRIMRNYLQSAIIGILSNTNQNKNEEKLNNLENKINSFEIIIKDFINSFKKNNENNVKNNENK
jgi:hypothetical protein